MKIKFGRLFVLLLILAVAVVGAYYLLPDGEQEDAPEIQEATEQEKILARAEEILSDMTLREKLYQMFIVTPDTLAGGTGAQSASSIKAGIEQYPVGGLIFFADNIQSKRQVKSMISGAMKNAEYPMFIAVDQEGGMVARLKENVDFPIFENMYEYKDEGATKAYENAKTMGAEMKKLGFNLDFAPVADVWSNPANTVIGKRAYSDDYAQAAVLVPEAVRGFHDGGVICSLKHFPGHGDTLNDTHHSLAYVTKTKDELNAAEMLPFKAGMEAGADMVMVGHLMVDQLDAENPASVSKAIVTDYLKKGLGFSGLVITDALNMGAIANRYSAGELGKRVVEAGVDILLMPTELRATAAGIETAVKNGEISEARIDESVLKILVLKLQYGIMK